MKKLSEAGKLYLQDFYILNEARNDASVFLDAVMSQAYQDLLREIRDLPAPGEPFTWKVWKSETNPGVLEVWPSAKKDIIPFGKGREDLYVICRDVRRGELDNTNCISVVIGCSLRFFNSLKRDVSSEVRDLALKAAAKCGTSIVMDAKRTLYKKEVSLNLDNATDSADSIAEFIMERCRGMREFALQIIK